MIPYMCMARSFVASHVLSPLDLSPRQAELLSYIEQVSSEDHRMPSYREMAAALKLSAVGSIQDLIRVLLEKKYLTKQGRHLVLSSKRQSSVVQVPLVGVVAAGSLTEAIDHHLGMIAFSRNMVNSKKNSKFFALRVQGESMIEAGIFHGDYILVDSGIEARSGEAVVVRFRGEATVKEIFFKGKEIVLRPRNKNLKDIVVLDDQRSELEILGKVLLVQRILS
jgi:repressor LexA